MSNVVSEAIKIEGEGHTWLIRFSTGENKTGPVTHIAGDIYRILNLNAEHYFDVDHVVFMTKIIPRK